jgi:hypothetical protein
MAQKSNSFGGSGGQFVMGEVEDDQDPAQAGQYKVRWDMGGQSDMGKDDLPWSRAMMPANQPNIRTQNGKNGPVGGPVTGLIPKTRGKGGQGSKVFGIRIDGATGQECIILGQCGPKGGDGDADGSSSPNSEAPTPAKDKSGDSQPEHGDKNYVVTDKAITEWPREEGFQGKKMRHADLGKGNEDVIGLLGYDKPIKS